MKTNQNNPHYEGCSHSQSNHRPYVDFNVLDPSPEMDLNFLEDEDDEITGSAFLDYPDEQDFTG